MQDNLVRFYQRHLNAVTLEVQRMDQRRHDALQAVAAASVIDAETIERIAREKAHNLAR